MNVRATPSTSGDIVTALGEDQAVTITGDPQDADGYTWVPVRLADGTQGWVVQEFLAPAG